MPRPDDVPVAVRDLAMRLAEPRPMRRGSLSERYMKCGQAGCPLPARPPGAAWAVLQFDAGGSRPDALALRGRRAGGPGAGAGGGRPAVPGARRSLLAGLRTVGRRPTGRARGGGAGGGQKKGFSEAFAAEVVAEIEALVGPGAATGLDFEAIETAARRRALTVAARAVARRLNADTSDHAGPTLPCACGKAARYAGRRPKTFQTVTGRDDPGARLLPLRRRARQASVRATGRWAWYSTVALARRHAHGGAGGGDGQLRREQRADAGAGRRAG